MADFLMLAGLALAGWEILLGVFWKYWEESPLCVCDSGGFRIEFSFCCCFDREDDFISFFISSTAGLTSSLTSRGSELGYIDRPMREPFKFSVAGPCPVWFLNTLKLLVNVLIVSEVSLTLSFMNLESGSRLLLNFGWVYFCLSREAKYLYIFLMCL